MLRKLNKRQGFTLVEIVIVVGISLCILAISVYSFLRGRVNANDSAASGSVEAIAAALEAYQMSKGDYTGSLNDLTSANPPYLSESFSDGKNQGYKYSIFTGGGNDYTILAQPEIYGITGTKYIVYSRGSILAFNDLGSAENYLGIEDDGGGDDGDEDGEHGGGCFLGDTPILLADGSSKPIRDITIGDKVIAFDEEAGEFKEDKVVKFFEHESGEYLIINDYLKVTSNHPVYSDGKWVEIGTLKVGDNLFNSEGKPEEITSIKLVKEPVLVYNLEVNPYHTYIAGGIVAHNKKQIEMVNTGD